MPLRALLRGVLALALLVALTVAGLAIYGGARDRAARARFAEQFGEPDLTALAVPKIAAEFNAATWLVRGAEALAKNDADRKELVRLAVLAPRDWTPEDSAAADRALGSRRRALELLHHAAACERGNFDIDCSLGSNAPTPEYPSLVHASKVLLVDARSALARGDSATAVLDLNTLASTIDALAEDSLLISTIVAFAIDGQYLALARDLLATWPREADLLTSLDRHLSRRDLRRSVRNGLRGEGAMIASADTSLLVHEHRTTLLGRLKIVLYTPFEQLFKADLMDDYSEFAEGLDLSWPLLQQRVSNRLENPRFWNRHVSLLVNLEDQAKKLKGLESSYGLARAAALFASTGTRTELGLDPFTGEQAFASVLPRGGYTFSAPGAESLWRQVLSVQPNTSVPPFDWPVPDS